MLDTLAVLREAEVPLLFNVLSAEPGTARIIGLGNGKQPFVWRTYWSATSDGTRLNMAKEERRPPSQAMGSLTITTITMAGDTAGSRRIGVEREPVTDADVVDVRDESTWIRRAGSNRSAETQYLAVRPDDGALFRASLPASFRLLRASDTTLRGWSRDADGLPVIERFRAASRD